MRHSSERICDFDIDRYIDPIIPASPLPKLPGPISWFLGHRDKPEKHVCAPLLWIWSFVGAFCGVALVEGVYRCTSIQHLHPPVIISSLGAAAILEYNTIESVLSQPRPAILSQAISAFIGVGITKLFAHLPHGRFEDLRWLAGALAVGLSSVAMSITKTVHPPAGATALLAATSPDIIQLGWWLVALAVLGAVLMVASACLINNIQRQFPLYWWTATDLGKQRARDNNTADVEKASTEAAPQTPVTGTSLQRVESRPAEKSEIKITPEGVMIPDWLEIDSWERGLLETLQMRLVEDTLNESSRESLSKEDEKSSSSAKNT